ncbi:MAG: rRNA adenine N-6-methyltransferase family protein [Elusimicrobiota bacterium]
MKNSHKEKDLIDRVEDFLNEKRELLDQLEEFYEKKVEGKVRRGYDKLEQVLKKEIHIGNGKGELLEYDDESPFSYIAAYVRDKGVAAVMPSSKFVIRRVLKAMNLSKVRTVVEYGPAEGVITRKILSQLGEDGVLVAIERNPSFIKTLKRKIDDPRLRIVSGNVLDVDAILTSEGLDGMDVAVSGIPFSMFNQRERHLVLESTLQRLNPGGRFVAYQFTTHLIPLLKCYFKKVDIQLEVRNIPPHFVFTCHK